MKKKIKKKLKAKKIVVRVKPKNQAKKHKVPKPVKKIVHVETPVKKPEAGIFEGVHRAKIRIIGIGGGGGSIISGIASRIKRADFVAANTDARALKILDDRIKKFQFGVNQTKGLGTGMNVEVGESAAEEDKEKIQKIFEGQDLCIIISCLGGGTASGAAPIFAKIAKSAGCLTYGIFTLPFSFEGEKKTLIAQQALQKIKPYFNIFSVIPNEGIFQIIDKNTPLQDALAAINDRLVNNLEGLIERIFSVGLINIDFADLKTILAGYGKLSYLNTIEIDESHKEDAARRVASTPLYPYTFKGSKGILYNIVGGKSLCLSDVHKISNIISESVNKNAKIIFGINQNASNAETIKLTLLAVGCQAKSEFMGIKEPEEETKEINNTVKKEIKKKKSIKPKVKKENPKAKHKRKTVAKKKKAKSAKMVQAEVVTQKAEVRLPVVRIENNSGVELMADQKVRRTALEVKKVVEEEEKELLERENIWETPAILRRRDK
jgi:cell division protein FtsZ